MEVVRAFLGLAILLGVTSGTLAAWGVAAHHWQLGEDAFFIACWFVLPVALAAGLATGNRLIFEQEVPWLRQFREFLTWFAPMLGIGTVYAIGGIGLLYVAQKSFVWFVQTTKAQGTVIVIAIGSAAFAFRHYRRATYGLTEATVGLVVGTSRFASALAEHGAVSAADWTNVALGVLVAGVYLFVRGLDNIHQGLVKDPKDPWALALVRRMRSLGPLLRRDSRTHLMPPSAERPPGSR